uniref:TNFR-Cys domain-containing protein n=1 Tax=Gadus morhua TaxID=8049 RepID=A0A8C4Z525_GADMO
MGILILTICFGLSVATLVGQSAMVSATCPPNEYRRGLECCPSCPAGRNHIYELLITKCSRCPGGTFQAGYNELKQCSTCTKCDAGTSKSCSSTSDAVCEVLDGFFCSDSNGGGCRAAQRHTVCSPGQYIGQRGTADKDTECLHCTDGTFSDGTSTSCQNHTK